MRALWKGLWLSLFIVALLAGCGDSGTSKLTNELKTSYTYNGKRVEVTGYLRTGARGAFVKNGKVSLMLTPSMWSNDSKGEALVDNVEMNYGKGPNSFYAPEKFTGKDIEFRDNTGKQYGVNTKFKVSGVVQYDSTAQITEPQLPSGPFVLPVQKQVYEQQLAAYNEKKKSGNLYDYSYRLVDVTLEKD